MLLAPEVIVEPKTEKEKDTKSFIEALGFSELTEKFSKLPALRDAFDFIGDTATQFKEKFASAKETFEEKFKELAQNPRLKIFRPDEEALVFRICEGVLSEETRESISSQLKATVAEYKLSDSEQASKSQVIYNKVVWPAFYAKIAAVAGFGAYMAIETKSIDKCFEFIKEHLPPINAESIGAFSAYWIAYEELGPKLIQLALFSTGIYETYKATEAANKMRDYFESIGVVASECRTSYLKHATRG